MLKRILTTCTTCDASVQTDEDQTPSPFPSDLFTELVYSLTDENVIDHQHSLIHEEV